MVQPPPCSAFAVFGLNRAGAAASGSAPPTNLLSGSGLPDASSAACPSVRPGSVQGHGQAWRTASCDAEGRRTAHPVADTRHLSTRRQSSPAAIHLSIRSSPGDSPRASARSRGARCTRVAPLLAVGRVVRTPDVERGADEALRGARDDAAGGKEHHLDRPVFCHADVLVRPRFRPGFPGGFVFRSYRAGC